MRANAASRLRHTLAIAALVAVGVGLMVPTAAAAASRHQVSIAYIAPKAEKHRGIYEMLRKKGVLEDFRDVLSPFRLPHGLTLKLEGCDGVENAWYDSDDGTVTVCYEYIERVMHDAPKATTPAGVTPEDALIGPTAEVFLHEFAHALFDLLKIPVLGPEEAAADAVAAYTLLQFGPKYARRAIGGVAYMYAVQGKGEKLSVKSAAEVHPLTQQRFYSLLCIAYGADSKTFGYVVQKGYLPASRAETCEDEYAQVDYAVRTLLRPHVNRAQQKKVRAKIMRKLSQDQ